MTSAVLLLLVAWLWVVTRSGPPAWSVVPVVVALLLVALLLVALVAVERRLGR